MKKVEIDWVDASHTRGWNSEDHYRRNAKIARCRTVGYLFIHDDKQITVLLTQSDDGDVTDAMNIPRGCIKKLRYLK